MAEPLQERVLARAVVPDVARATLKSALLTLSLRGFTKVRVMLEHADVTARRQDYLHYFVRPSGQSPSGGIIVAVETTIMVSITATMPGDW